MQIQNDVKTTQIYQAGDQANSEGLNTGALEKALKMFADESGANYKSLMNSLTTTNDDKSQDLVAMKKSVLKTLVDRIRIMRADRFTDRSWTKLLSALRKALPICNASSPSELSVTKAINNVLSGLTGLVDAEIEDRRGSEDDKKNIFINEAIRQAAKAQAENSMVELPATGAQDAGVPATGAFSEPAFSDGTGTIIEISV